MSYCNICDTYLSDGKAMIHHYKYSHRSCNNFECTLDSCNRNFSLLKSFTKHVCEKHKNQYNLNMNMTLRQMSVIMLKCK